VCKRARGSRCGILLVSPFDFFNTSFRAVGAHKGIDFSCFMSSVAEQNLASLDLHAELQRLFGYDAFLGMQEQVIRQVMHGIDTLAVMPTGAGKSLCYQLPAMLLPGTTLVISPLIALMKDQYDSLPAGVYERTTFLNSSLEADALEQRMAEVVEGRYKIVYCAPERLRQQPFVDALRRADISMLVVDEAHCVSMWGHDFRPDYLFIGRCLQQLGHPLLLGLTATATPEIREEISGQLGRALKPVVASVFRPNLYYEVEEFNDKEAKLKRLVEICKAERGSGVVYARSRDTCEQLAMMLRRSGVQAAHYHAGMEQAARSETQEMFMLDRVRVIVATIAFGMGIDKSNVRFIVHFSPPDSLEGYAQESGRAGRDGRDARCVLFISPGDKSNLTRWKRQEEMKVEDLRAIYRELARQVPAGTAGFVNLDELERLASEQAGREFGQSGARVAVSLLERASLLVRHPDAPRSLLIVTTTKGSQVQDEDFSRFIEASGVVQGEYTRVFAANLCQVLGVAPDELERRLLHWAEMGWVRFRGERREAVIERLKPPSDAAKSIADILQKQDDAMVRQVEQVLRYAYADRCRHQMLAEHLGEKIEECLTSCDFCNPPEDRPAKAEAKTPDLPDNPGQVIVECLSSFTFRVGKRSLVNALTGSAASNVKPGQVKHFGALAGVSGSALNKAIDTLVEKEYLGYYESEDGYKLLFITEEGMEGVPSDVVTLEKKRERKSKQLDRSERISLSASRRDTVRKPDTDDGPPPTEEESDLFERLRAWRRATANRLGLPPYVIFHDRTLWALAKAKPANEQELLQVKGMGRVQYEKYGEELLELINE
jgi:ATP-dependent DNA helicase RecQ